MRRVKRAERYHQANSLFEASLRGEVNLMKEMKRVVTGTGPADDIADVVDGAVGQDNIAGKFKEVYQNLYNSATSEETVKEILSNLQMKIQEKRTDSVKEVQKLTGQTVKDAVNSMKKQKLDISQGFSSESLINAPEILFHVLSLIFKDWLVHGTVSKFILSCAFIPLLKGNLKDPTASDSYRAIAASSLILKVFEKCILLIWGDALESDSLQFGFKKNCGTDTASWLVQEVLSHYVREGSKPIAVILDCTKAFDLARHDVLFQRLQERLPEIVVRVLIFSYREQKAWVRWGREVTSSIFNISNGTRQGSVGSPSFWSVYLNPLFDLLRRADIGCRLGGLFVGVVGYADDLILLAPCRRAAVKMIEICEKFAEENNIVFSINDNPDKSKSKTMYVVGYGEKNLPPPEQLYLCGTPLPWVKKADHLGNLLSSEGTMESDARQKLAKYIDGSVKIRENFFFAHPQDQINAI